MKTLDVINADGVALKLQQVKVEVGGIASDDEIALSISEDGMYVEMWRDSKPIRLSESQAKRFARQLSRMCRELKTAVERSGAVSRLTDKERFCLDAYLVNGDSCAAYLLSREAPIAPTSSESLAVMVSRWFSSKKVVEYLAMRKAIKSLSAESINYIPIIDKSTKQG